MSTKVVVITGGSSGIGKATAQLFSNKGYKVYELSRHENNASNDIRHINCDVTQPQQCVAAVEEVVKQCGRIDVLICNAGMGISGPAEFSSLAEVKRQMDVNFFGVVNMVQAVLPVMRSACSGRILFVSSLAAIFPLPFQAYYSASKSAVSSLSLSLSNELRPFGIKVACIMPGEVHTAFTEARTKCNEGSAIYTQLKKATEIMEHEEHGGMSPNKIACTLYRMAQTRRLHAFYTVGLKYKLCLFVRRFLPNGLINRIVGQLY